MLLVCKAGVSPSKLARESVPPGIHPKPHIESMRVCSFHGTATTINVALQIRPGQISINDARKGTVWCCIGNAPERLHESFRTATERDDYLLGAGFIAARCRDLVSSKVQADTWLATVDLGDEALDEEMTIGGTVYKATELPISWYYVDDSNSISNQLKTVLNLEQRTSRVISAQ